MKTLAICRMTIDGERLVFEGDGALPALVYGVLSKGYCSLWIQHVQAVRYARVPGRWF